MTKGAVGNDMDRKTRKALKESIAHWYRISACETKEELYREGYFGEDCALCRMFNGEDNLFFLLSACHGCPVLSACHGCPVSQATGVCCCKKSPYKAALNSLNRWLYTGEWYNTDQDNIEAEIRFLEGLLEG